MAVTMEQYSHSVTRLVLFGFKSKLKATVVAAEQQHLFYPQEGPTTISRLMSRSNQIKKTTAKITIPVIRVRLLQMNCNSTDATSA